MKTQFSIRTFSLALAFAGVLTTTTASAATALFEGGGFGATPEGAIQAAIWDAEASASAEGFFECEIVGQPAVFPQPPNSRRAFTAQVTLRCEQWALTD